MVVVVPTGRHIADPASSGFRARTESAMFGDTAAELLKALERGRSSGSFAAFDVRLPSSVAAVAVVVGCCCCCHRLLLPPPLRLAPVTFLWRQ